MALFNKKTPAEKSVAVAESKKAKAVKAEKKDEIAVLAAKDAKAAKAKTGGLELNMILLRPHVTEKATDLSEKNVFVFDIARGANKAQVRQAVEKFYKVQPTKVAVIVGAPKYMKNPRTGRMQTKKTAIKKALVYLKKGDTIEFV
jgi:large subunit ribosomal protein L23